MRLMQPRLMIVAKCIPKNKLTETTLNLKIVSNSFGFVLLLPYLYYVRLKSKFIYMKRFYIPILVPTKLVHLYLMITNPYYRKACPLERSFIMNPIR